MRILVVNGSPRGKEGGCFKLASAFLEGVALRRQAEAQVVEVAALRINSCLGCLECLEDAEGLCRFDDDMGDFTLSLLQAEAVLWCFPLWNYSLPSQLKALIERLLPATGRGRGFLASKRHILVSTCGLSDAGSFKAVRAQFDLMLGEGNHQALLAVQGRLLSMPGMDARTARLLDLARRAGEEFAEGRIREETLRALSEPLVEEKTYGELASRSGDLVLAQARQLAALYNKRAWRKADIVLQLSFVDLGRDIQIVLGRDGARVLEDNLLRPTTVVETPMPVWRKVARGEENLNRALMESRLRVTGDVHTINRWDYLFGTAVDDRSFPKKPNLLFMLAPWIVIWTVLRASPSTGAMVALALFGAFPLLFLLFRPLAFERISLFVCPILALLSLAGVEFYIIKGVSYLFLGIMWGATLLGRYPLPAYYMTGGFGREKAFSNPLYLHIQKVVCILWTVLQILMAAWTFAIPQIGSILTAVGCATVGSFTGFFQGWYPRHHASRPLRKP